MRFSQIQPPDHLKGYVRYFWTLESDGLATEPARPVDTPMAVDPSRATDPLAMANPTNMVDPLLPKTFRTMADGCPGLIYQQAENGHLYQNGKRLPETCLYGQSTRHAEVSLVGEFNTIGIFFYPDALRSVFGINAEKLTDGCMDLSGMGDRGFNLSQRLADSTSMTDQVQVLSAWLFSLVKKNHAQEDQTMRYILSRIVGSGGNLTIKELQSELNLSERSLERRFKQHIGISPKLFTRICRFQASLSQLRTNKYNKLSDVAFEQDYADQSHFIRSFKEFAGLSPYQYLSRSNEIVENFSALE